MLDFYKLKLLKNPADFEIGFAAIAYKPKLSVLVIFDKNSNVIKCRKYRSLFLAMTSFFNLYARRKNLKPTWSRETIKRRPGFYNDLVIDDDTRNTWKKLDNILNGSNEEKQIQFKKSALL